MIRGDGKISVAIPIYNEEKNIPSLHARLRPVLESMGHPYEVVFVDDGSRDGSLDLLKMAAHQDPEHIQVIELSRNFGQHPALLAAFRYAAGEHVITLDADLQNPPEEIPKIVAKLREGYDVVGGVRVHRQDTFFRKLASRIVNRVTVFITKMRLNDYGCMLRGYAREVVDQINTCEENSTFIPALGLLFARRPVEIPVQHASRTAGHSKYSFYRLIRLNFDLMTGFSVVPLQLFTLFGFLTASGGFLFGFYLLVRRYVLLRESEAEGVFTLFALAFVALGVLMAGLGIVGEYIGRIYQEVRGRPRYSVRHIYGTVIPAKAGIQVLDLPSNEGLMPGSPLSRGRRLVVSRPRIVVFAYSDLGHACLRLLLERGENVVAVYTHEDRPGEKLWFPSVYKLAEERSIPVRTEEDLGKESELAHLKASSPDMIFSFYYRNLIPAAVLDLPRLGAFNMHGSFLPTYRGRAPVNWAVLNGETKTGATLHVMIDRPDAGDIIDQEEVDIGPDDAAAVVQARVTQAAVDVLTRQIENLKKGTAPRIPQDPTQASYFGRRRPEDGEINWNWPAARIHNLVRAVTHPYPGAFGDLHGEKTWIWKTRLRPLDSEGLLVTCGDGNKLEILILQREGEREITGQEFAQRTVAIGRKKS